MGIRHEALGRAAALVAARGARAQLCVRGTGGLVLDEASGCRPDDAFLLFSAGKPFVAVLVHQLAEQGRLDLDAPVARYWPAFAARGKEAVTVRQVLQHRAGLPVARGIGADAVTALSWSRSVRALERARPRHPPGEVAAYHILSYGFLLGEVVQRVTGRPVRDVLQAELLDPLGLTGIHLGLPPGAWDRRVPVRARGIGAPLRQWAFNTPAVRRAVVPAATVSGTARDLARFYLMLLRGGELDGVRVLRPETVAAMRRPSSDGVDAFLRLPIRWSEGFQLGGPSPGRPRPMGATSSPETFGHNGSNACLGWADPTRGIAFAYLTDLLPGGFEGGTHLAEVSDAVLAAFG